MPTRYEFVIAAYASSASAAFKIVTVSTIAAGHSRALVIADIVAAYRGKPVSRAVEDNLRPPVVF
jgi:hypothetical protein